MGGNVVVRPAITVARHERLGQQKPRADLKKATEKDLKKIARGCNTPDQWVISNVTAPEMGFDVDYQQVGKISQLVRERLVKEQKAEQETLDQKFQEAVLEIINGCRYCGNQVIKAKVEHHTHSSGEIMTGRNNSFTSTDIPFLYCTGCGQVYYKDQVEELRQRLNKGEFKAKDRISREPFC